MANQNVRSQANNHILRQPKERATGKSMQSMHIEDEVFVGQTTLPFDVFFLYALENFHYLGRIGCARKAERQYLLSEKYDSFLIPAMSLEDVQCATQVLKMLKGLGKRVMLVVNNVVDFETLLAQVLSEMKDTRQAAQFPNYDTVQFHITNPFNV